MQSTKEELMLLLVKWRDEGTQLQLVASFPQPGGLNAWLEMTGLVRLDGKTASFKLISEKGSEFICELTENIGYGTPADLSDDVLRKLLPNQADVRDIAFIRGQANTAVMLFTLN